MGRPRPPRAVRSRAARLTGLAVVVVGSTLAAGYLLLPVAVRLLIAVLDVTMTAGVSLASLAGSDRATSAILIAMGRALLRALTSTWALVVLAALVSVGGAALYGIRYLLGLEGEESSR